MDGREKNNKEAGGYPLLLSKAAGELRHGLCACHACTRFLHFFTYIALFLYTFTSAKRTQSPGSGIVSSARK